MNSKVVYRHDSVPGGRKPEGLEKNRGLAKSIGQGHWKTFCEISFHILKHYEIQTKLDHMNCPSANKGTKAEDPLAISTFVYLQRSTNAAFDHL